MKIKPSIVVLSVLLTVSAVNVHAAPVDGKRPLKERVATMNETEKKARMEEINVRVDEIKSMDKSSLTRSERKDLRQELRQMNKEARAMHSGGVYLSIGALVIIGLLLIILI